MRAGAVRPTGVSGGFLLVGIGALILALSLAFLAIDGGRGSNSSAPATVADRVETTDASIAFWEARVAGDPSDFVALNRLSALYIQRARETGDVSDYGRAQAAVDQSLASLPGDNYSGYATLAALQNVRHEFAVAAETARKAIPLAPADVYAKAVLGDAQVALGQYDEAFVTYNEIVDQAPSLSTFSRIAYIYELRGELDEAEGAWNNAFSIDSGRSAEALAWARVQFGNFYFNQGDLSRAGVQYTASLEVLPNYIHGIAAQAKLAAANGDYDQAVALYAQVTERQPLPEYIAALGDVYQVTGRTTDAERQYEVVGVIEELYVANGINTDLQTALYLADHDIRIDDAVRQALAVYGQQPDSIYAADAVAWTLHKAGRAEEALPYLQEALRLGTQDASIYFHAGLVHNAVGDSAGARDYLNAAIEMNPHFSLINSPIAQETLEGLRG